MFHVKQSGAGPVNNMVEDVRCVITARLFREEKCFGPGIAELLEGIEELKSLRAAAMRMGMAYSKAWRIIHECEEKLGFRLLYSSAGGRGGGEKAAEPFPHAGKGAEQNRGCAAASLAGRGRKFVNKLETDMLMY